VLTANAAARTSSVGADKDAPVVGTADNGSGVQAEGQAGEFGRVEIDWAAGLHRQTGAAKGRRRGGGGEGGVGQKWQVSPQRPRSTRAPGAPLVDTSTIHLSSTAKDEHKVAGHVRVRVEPLGERLSIGASVLSRQRKRRNKEDSSRSTPRSRVAGPPTWLTGGGARVDGRCSHSRRSSSKRREPRVGAGKTHAKTAAPLETGGKKPVAAVVAEEANAELAANARSRNRI